MTLILSCSFQVENNCHHIFKTKSGQVHLLEYLDEIVQNWDEEEFIEGSYVFHNEKEPQNIEALAEPMEEKVFFAGEAYNLSGWNATVNGAAQSAYQCIDSIFN